MSDADIHKFHVNIQLLEEKLEPEEHQKAVLESLNKAAGLGVSQRRRKPKRRKGPNPLSVKRSQKAFMKDKVIKGGVVSRSKVDYIIGYINVCFEAFSLLVWKLCFRDRPMGTATRSVIN